MDRIHEAVISLLTQKGFIRDDELKENLQFIRRDCDVDQAVNLTPSTLFSAINAKIRKFSFEIKSINLTNSNNVRVMYHGMVNTEEDFVAKEFGSPLDAMELKYFSRIASKLLEKKYLSTDELSDLRPMDKMRRDEALTLISRLELLGWLRRNDSNYMILGVRAHLELRSFFECLIMESVDLDGIESNKERVEKEAQLKEWVAELPQIFVY